MANKFNPSVNPTGDPNYLAYSRGISVPDTIKPQGQGANEIRPQGAQFQGAVYEGNKHVDESGRYAGIAEGMTKSGQGELFAGIAGAADLAVKGADAVIKKDIDNTVYQAVDRERDGYAAALTAVKGGTGKLDVLSGDPEHMPDDVENIGASVETIQGARDAGKISNTQYIGRLKAISKNIRSTYPGYREYIDKEISRVTGMDPANAYIASLVSDINRASAQRAGAANKLDSFAKANFGVLGTEQIWEGVKAGKIPEINLYRHVAAYKEQESRLHRAALEFTGQENKRKDEERKATSLATDEATVAANNDFRVFQETTNTNTPGKIADVVAKLNNGQLAADDTQVQQLGQQFQQMRVNAENKLWMEWSQPNPNGVTRIQALGGPAKAKEALKASMFVYDQVSDSIYNKEWGAAYEKMRANKSLIEDRSNKLLTDMNIGRAMQDGAAMKQLGGDEFAKYFVENSLRSDLGDSFKTWHNSEVAKAVTQPDLRTTGVTSVKKALTKLETAGQATPSQVAAVTNVPTMITDPKLSDAGKTNLAIHTFGPGNAGVLSKFAADNTDPDTGRRLPGKFSIFQKWTSPEMTSEIKRLSTTDPNVGRNYLTWVDKTFQFDLAQREVKDLNTIQANPNLGIAWNSDTTQWSLYEGRGTPGNAGVATTESEKALNKVPLNQDEIRRARNTIENLNTAIRSVRGAVTGMGGTDTDFNTYVLNTMVSMGLDPTISNPEGIPDKMIAAITASKNEAKLKAQKSQEGKTFMEKFTTGNY